MIKRVLFKIAFFLTAAITGALISFVHLWIWIESIEDDMANVGMSSGMVDNRFMKILHLPLTFCGVTELLVRDDHTNEFTSGSVIIDDEHFPEFHFLFEPRNYSIVVFPKRSTCMYKNFLDEYIYVTFYSLEDCDEYIVYIDLDKDGRLDVMRVHSYTLPSVEYVFMENSWIEVVEWIERNISAKIQGDKSFVDVVFTDGRWVVCSDK